MKITIFDLDDTLLRSKARVRIYDAVTRKTFLLTPSQFNLFVPAIHHHLSYEEFESRKILSKSTLLPLFHKFNEMYLNNEPLGIVTARSDSLMIHEFLKERNVDIDIDLIYAVTHPFHGFQGGVADRKKQAFEKLILRGYTEFEFYDDNDENLALVKSLEIERPVKITTFHVDGKVQKAHRRGKTTPADPR